MSARVVQRRAHLLQDLVAVVHLHLEGGSVGKDEIVCSHARIDGIDRGDAGFRSRDVTSDCRFVHGSEERMPAIRTKGRLTLGHDDCRASHAEESTLSRHLHAQRQVSHALLLAVLAVSPYVGSGQKSQVLGFAADGDVVRDKVRLGAAKAKACASAKRGTIILTRPARTHLKMHGCLSSSKSANAVSASTISGRTHGSPRAAELFERLKRQSS